MNRTMTYLVILSIAALALSGCVTHPPSLNGRPCSQNCNVQIRLADPKGPDDPPEVTPERMEIKGGSELHFDVAVAGSAPNNAALTLVFEEAIVRRGQQGPWLYTVNLTHGRNTFRVHEAEPGLCDDSDGCKYLVIDRGNPHRPSLINSPMVRILR